MMRKIVKVIDCSIQFVGDEANTLRPTNASTTTPNERGYFFHALTFAQRALAAREIFLRAAALIVRFGLAGAFEATGEPKI